MKTKTIVLIALILFTILVGYIFTFGFFLNKAPTTLENVSSIVKKEDNTSVTPTSAVASTSDQTQTTTPVQTSTTSVRNYRTRTAAS